MRFAPRATALAALTLALVAPAAGAHAQGNHWKTLAAMEGGCYALIYKFGGSDINAGIVLAIGLAQLIIASFIKIALLQSLDANLIVPTTTELVTLVYFICLVLAFLVSRRLPVVRLRAHSDPNQRTLEWLIIMSSVLMRMVLLVELMLVTVPAKA